MRHDFALRALSLTVTEVNYGYGSWYGHEMSVVLISNRAIYLQRGVNGGAERGGGGGPLLIGWGRGRCLWGVGALLIESGGWGALLIESGRGGWGRCS